MGTVDEVIEVLVRLHGEGRDGFARRYGAEALAVVSELEKLLEPRLSVYGPLWSQFTLQPQLMGAALAPILQALLTTDAALSKEVEARLQRLHALPAPAQSVHTGGGAYVQGGVTLQGGGDFVGRDKVVITGDGNVVGDHNVVTVTKSSGLDAAQMRALFEQWQGMVAAASGEGRCTC